MDGELAAAPGIVRQGKTGCFDWGWLTSLSVGHVHDDCQPVGPDAIPSPPLGIYRELECVARCLGFVGGMIQIGKLL